MVNLYRGFTAAYRTYNIYSIGSLVGLVVIACLLPAGSYWLGSKITLGSKFSGSAGDLSGLAYSLIPLSHYSKNVIRTYYEHEMLKFVVKSAGNFSFSKIWAHNTTDVRT